LHSQTNNLFHKIECWFHKFWGQLC
jgi:hypothetical protein